MGTAAKIQIAIEAQTATLKKGFDEAKGAINSLASGMSGAVASGMMKANLAIAAVKTGLNTLSGAIESVRGAMADMDRSAKFAARLGADADQLTALGFAAEQSGASAEVLNASLEKMQKKLGEALAGNKEATAAFGALGLQVQQLKGLSADQVFAKIAEQMQGLGDNTEATRIAMKIFEEAGGQLLPMLKGGAEGLNEMGRQAESMGLLLGDARGGVEAANDAINAMKRSWGAFVQQVATLVAPALKAIADLLTSIVSAFNRLMGKTTGATVPFKAYETEAKKAAIHIDKSMKETEKTAAKAAAKIKDTWKDIPKPSDYTTPGIGAVTRGTVAGFSAAQEAQRRDADRKRYEQETLRWQQQMLHATKENKGLVLAPVNI